MRAYICFKDGKEVAIDDLKYINKKSGSGFTKFEKFDEFFVDNTYYIFVGEKDTTAILGTEVLYVKFNS